uniref:ChaB family protein n=1 Tax=Cyanothece sp. (strain PCC 7425 / ATCC 29141) TaxID=395961 RepID=B8HQN5_CYAP4
MLYQTNRDLPIAIRELPEPVQDLYRIAFNSALHWYGEEKKAHQTAWSAVKSQLANPYSSYPTDPQVCPL